MKSSSYPSSSNHFNGQWERPEGLDKKPTNFVFVVSFNLPYEIMKTLIYLHFYSKDGKIKWGVKKIFFFPFLSF